MSRTIGYLSFLFVSIGVVAWARMGSSPQDAMSLPYVRLQPTTPGTRQNGNTNIDGVMKAFMFDGDGSALTGLNASRLSFGTVNDSRLSGNVALLSGAQTFSGPKLFGAGLSTTAFRLSSSPSEGFVLTSDASGNGSWQPLLWQPSGSDIFFTDGNVGIGTNSPAYTLDIAGRMSATGPGGPANPTAEFRNTGSASSAIWAAGPIGVHGYGTAGGSAGAGLYGNTNANNGRAIVGNASGNGECYGLYVSANGTTSSVGVSGTATGGSFPTYGGVFVAESMAGTGVVGHATAADGNTIGGDFTSESDLFGIGVRGTNNAASGLTYGVVGQVTSSSGYGVWSTGNFGASGTKSFRIDHPLDPENRYLLHYCTESPMPQNTYQGNVVTDGRGYAWVELPRYFQEINVNFKYQLTVVDDSDSDSFVMAKVSKKIRGTRFQIRTSAPNVEVSWEVKADRNDLFVRDRKPRDEIDKSEREHGLYLHPELYGQPANKGVFWRPGHQRESQAPLSGQRGSIPPKPGR